MFLMLKLVKRMSEGHGLSFQGSAVKGHIRSDIFAGSRLFFFFNWCLFLCSFTFLSCFLSSLVITLVGIVLFPFTTRP